MRLTDLRKEQVVKKLHLGIASSGYCPCPHRAPPLGKNQKRGLFRLAAGQHGAAGDAGAVAEFGGVDLDAFHRAGHGVVLRGLDGDAHHLVGQRLDDAAAHHHDFRAEDVHQVGDANADILGGAFDDFIHELVTPADGFAQVAAAQVAEVVAEHFGQQGLLAVFDAGFDLLKDGGAAGQRLKTAFVAAAALGAVDVEHHVTDLPGGVVESAVKVAVDDEAAADAGADEDADEALGLAFELDDVDAQRADVAVVFDEYRHAEKLLQVLLQQHVLPAFHVRGEDDPALGKIHRARRANANAGDLLEVEVGFIHRVLHAARDALDDGIAAALGLSAELGATDALKRVLEDARQDLSAA